MKIEGIFINFEKYSMEIELINGEIIKELKLIDYIKDIKILPMKIQFFSWKIDQNYIYVKV